MNRTATRSLAALVFAGAALTPEYAHGYFTCNSEAMIEDCASEGGAGHQFTGESEPYDCYQLLEYECFDSQDQPLFWDWCADPPPPGSGCA